MNRTTTILLGIMAALPFGLLQGNWLIAGCFGVLVAFALFPKPK